MDSILLSVGVLACPLGMGAMMWFMARGMSNKDKHQQASPVSLATLRDEHDRLGNEIAQIQEHDKPLTASPS